MENRLYVIYNTLSQRYGDVCAYPSDGFAVARIQPAIGDFVKESELCRIGSIDVETGVVHTEPPVRIAWNDVPSKPVSPSVPVHQ